MSLLLSRPGRILLTAILCTLALRLAPASAMDAGLSDQGCYLVQMHIHGHSNHNGNDLPASMESQCSEAQRHGFDVIWWTDHAYLFVGYKKDIMIGFENAYFDADSSFLVFTHEMARGLSRFAIERPASGCHLDVKDRRLGILVESERRRRNLNMLVLRLASERGNINLLGFCRPVTSGLELRGRGQVSGLDEDTFVRFRFDFSWHPEGQHHAVFDLVSGGKSSYKVIGDTTVIQVVDIGDQDLDVRLDIDGALAHLPNGDDNTLSSCRIEIGARNGESIRLAIDSLTIASTRPEGENQYAMVQKLARRYEKTYGIKQYIGVEVGLLHRPRMPHMNAYLPKAGATYENTYYVSAIDRSEWVRSIHEAGGLVCFDHPFGAALRGGRLERIGLSADLSVRDLATKGSLVDEAEFWNVAEPILEENALGADMLEVGYLFRGIGTLEDHLRLWDLALANGIRLVGYGSSDSHGGRWGPDMRPNPFASWIWSDSKGADDLLKAMRSGRIAFGDPFLWKSKFAFGVGDAVMGDTLFVGDHEEVRGWIYMEPWRSDIDVRLVQIEIRNAREPNIIRQEALENIRNGFDLRVDKPCFARVEVYDKKGVPLVFSNPVYLIPR